MKLTLRGANSGLMTASGIVFGTQNACLRAVWFRAFVEENQQQPDLRASITFALGHSIEDVFEARLKASKIQYTKEKLIVDPITETVDFTGHMDFVNEDEGFPYELKSISSTGTAEKILVLSKPKLENIMQLAGYMVAMSVDKAKLCYGNTVYHKWVRVPEETWEAAKALKHPSVICQKDRVTKELTVRIEPCFKIFNIAIDNEGIVSYDGHNTTINVEDVVRYRETAAFYLENKQFPRERPTQIEGDFSPCFSCQWKNECKAFDENVFKDKEDLVFHAKNQLQKQMESSFKTLVL